MGSMKRRGFIQALGGLIAVPFLGREKKKEESKQPEVSPYMPPTFSMFFWCYRCQKTFHGEPALRYDAKVVPTFNGGRHLISGRSFCSLCARGQPDRHLRMMSEVAGEPYQCSGKYFFCETCRMKYWGPPAVFTQEPVYIDAVPIPDPCGGGSHGLWVPGEPKEYCIFCYPADPKPPSVHEDDLPPHRISLKEFAQRREAIEKEMFILKHPQGHRIEMDKE